MVDKTPGDRKLSVPNKTLTLKPRIETGTVKQSFSHGRTKQVVVEKRGKRRVPRMILLVGMLLPIVLNPANYYLHSVFLLTVLGIESSVVWLALLAMCLAMSARNGAKRWIPLGPLTFQPVGE